jgi:hypothetical protein
VHRIKKLALVISGFGLFVCINACGGNGNSATPQPTPTPPPAPQLAFNTTALSAPINTQIQVSSFTTTNCTTAGQITWTVKPQSTSTQASGATWPTHQAGTGGLGVIDMGNSIPGGPITASGAGSPVYTLTANCGGVTASLILTATVPPPPGVSVPAPAGSVSVTCTGTGVITQNPCVLQANTSINVTFDVKKTGSDVGTFGANDALNAGEWNGTLVGTANANCQSQPPFASSTWVSATEIKFGGAGSSGPAGQASLWFKNPPDMNGAGGGISCIPNAVTVQ